MRARFRLGAAIRRYNRSTAMSNPVAVYSTRNSALSLWQSAIHNVVLAKGAPNEHQGIGATAGSAAMLATNQVLQHFDQNGTFDAAPGAEPGPAEAKLAGVASTDLECAKLAAEIALCEATDPARAAQLKNVFDTSTCDPMWAECLVEYGRFRLSGGQQRYDPYTKLTDFVIDGCLPDNATIAVIGDWGTGMNSALVLLQQIGANFQPDVLLHLGDIYYSGLPRECANHFTTFLDQVWPEGGGQPRPLVFTLDGNHDRYAGSNGGYYELIANLNQAAGKPQPNSYFAIRNNFWQFLAMDTGYYDCDPNNVNSNLTKLVPEEATWHVDKIQNHGDGVDAIANPSGARRTVLLSHHQLFSFIGVGNDPVQNRPLAVNTNLAGAFAPVFGMIDLWLWGHEHNLCIFQPYTNGPGQPLPRGRCIGASAIPVFTSQAPAAPPNLLVPDGEPGPPQIIEGTALGNDGQVFNSCYAMITLKGPNLKIDYYQVSAANATPGNPPAPGAPIYSESIG